MCRIENASSTPILNPPDRLYRLRYFGGDILLDGELRQPRDMFQAEALLEPLKRLHDAPALLIEIGKQTGWKARRIEQVSAQNASLVIGRDVADQAHCLRLAGAFVSS